MVQLDLLAQFLFSPIAETLSGLDCNLYANQHFIIDNENTKIFVETLEEVWSDLGRREPCFESNICFGVLMRKVSPDPLLDPFQMSVVAVGRR